VVEGWGDGRVVDSECCSARREPSGGRSHCVHYYVFDKGGSVKGAVSLV
jgi:hypothetical protein